MGVIWGSIVVIKSDQELEKEVERELNEELVREIKRS